MKNSLFWIVDAFVGETGARKLRGNPAAVVLLDEFAADATMLERANEFNLAETAFVVSRGDLNFDLRWFTPQVEVDLCGHATLAATAALLEAGQMNEGEVAHFSTRSGVLSAATHSRGIELDFPAQPPSNCTTPSELCRALGVRPGESIYCGRGGEDWLLRVVPGVLGHLRPDFKKLMSFEGRGVIVTEEGPTGQSEYDFASRFFAPRVGVNEDPVTGSAHTVLTPFWSERLGKARMKALQLSERGGALEVELRGERVGIAGRTQNRAHGHLR